MLALRTCTSSPAESSVRRPLRRAHRGALPSVLLTHMLAMPCVTCAHVPKPAACDALPAGRAMPARIPGRFPPADQPRPLPGDRLLLFRKHWLDLVLAGDKVVEVRGMSCRPGGAWAGCDGRVHVWLEFGTSEYVSSVSAFRARLPEHHVDVAVLPYTRTHLWPILARRILPEPVPYHRAPGPVNWARFRPPGPGEPAWRWSCTV